jgi:phosphoglycolate phosphatase-like HAD superfamily hydrolase
VELARLLDWSEEVNAAVERIVRNVPPFPQVKPCLEKAKNAADMMVVSQTPFEALDREWKAHGIDSYVRAIAWQECGTKGKHLELAAKDKYENEKILMIGDAYGDLKAAKQVDALFYPILPGTRSRAGSASMTRRWTVFSRARTGANTRPGFPLSWRRRSPKRRHGNAERGFHLA